MKDAWGRILRRYGQRMEVCRGETAELCRAFLQPVRERGEQKSPTPLGVVERSQWLYLGPEEVPLEPADDCFVAWDGRRFDVRAAHPIYVGERPLYWWALLTARDAAPEDGTGEGL